MVKRRDFTNAFLNEVNDDSKLENDISQNTSENTQVANSDNNIEQEKENSIPNIEAESVPTVNTMEIISNDNNEKKMIQKTIIDESISTFVARKLIDTKKRMDLFYGNKTAFGKMTKKPKFSEMYSGVTISMNRDLNEIIEYLVVNSTYNKTQLLELLLITGLESLKF
jgi:hypothetical protein